MYGIINVAIENYVLNNYGENTWENVKSRYGTDIDFLLTEQPYNEEVFYKLAVLLAEETGITVDEALFNFGEHIMKTTREKYSGVLESRGNNLREYLISLPNFHNRIMLIYPNLSPPEFGISNIEDNSICVHYMYKKKGISSFVLGYLNGLILIFKEKATAQWLKTIESGQPQEVFKISW